MSFDDYLGGNGGIFDLGSFVTKKKNRKKSGFDDILSQAGITGGNFLGNEKGAFNDFGGFATPVKRKRRSREAIALGVRDEGIAFGLQNFGNAVGKSELFLGSDQFVNRKGTGKFQKDKRLAKQLAGSVGSQFGKFATTEVIEDEEIDGRKTGRKIKKRVVVKDQFGKPVKSDQIEDTVFAGRQLNPKIQNVIRTVRTKRKLKQSRKQSQFGSGLPSQFTQPKTKNTARQSAPSFRQQSATSTQATGRLSKSLFEQGTIAVSPVNPVRAKKKGARTNDKEINERLNEFPIFGAGQDITSTPVIPDDNNKKRGTKGLKPTSISGVLRGQLPKGSKQDTVTRGELDDDIDTKGFSENIEEQEETQKRKKLKEKKDLQRGELNTNKVKLQDGFQRIFGDKNIIGKSKTERKQERKAVAGLGTIPDISGFQKDVDEQEADSKKSEVTFGTKEERKTKRFSSLPDLSETRTVVTDPNILSEKFEDDNRQRSAPKKIRSFLSGVEKDEEEIRSRPITFASEEKPKDSVVSFADKNNIKADSLKTAIELANKSDPSILIVDELNTLTPETKSDKEELSEFVVDKDGKPVTLEEEARILKERDEKKKSKIKEENKGFGFLVDSPITSNIIMKNEIKPDDQRDKNTRLSLTTTQRDKLIEELEEGIKFDVEQQDTKNAEKKRNLIDKIRESKGKKEITVRLNKDDLEAGTDTLGIDEIGDKTFNSLVNKFSDKRSNLLDEKGEFVGITPRSQKDKPLEEIKQTREQRFDERVKEQVGLTMSTFGAGDTFDRTIELERDMRKEDENDLFKSKDKMTGVETGNFIPEPAIAKREENLRIKDSAISELVKMDEARADNDLTTNKKRGVDLLKKDVTEIEDSFVQNKEKQLERSDKRLIEKQERFENPMPERGGRRINPELAKKLAKADLEEEQGINEFLRSDESTDFINQAVKRKEDKQLAFKEKMAKEKEEREFEANRIDPSTPNIVKELKEKDRKRAIQGDVDGDGDVDFDDITKQASKNTDLTTGQAGDKPIGGFSVTSPDGRDGVGQIGDGRSGNTGVKSVDFARKLEKKSGKKINDPELDDDIRDAVKSGEISSEQIQSDRETKLNDPDDSKAQRSRANEKVDELENEVKQAESEVEKENLNSNEENK